MSETMTPYIVRQGDYVTKLAAVHGFDADEVWNDPKNEDLRKLRPDPNILAPGDILYIPENKKDELPIEKGTENNYSAKVPEVEIALVFQDQDGKPIAGEDYQILGLTQEGAPPPADQTKDDGVITLKVPVTLREASVTFPRRALTFVVGIGDMDPKEEMSGIVKRLDNLGFYYVDAELGIDPDTALRSATIAFQRSTTPPRRPSSTIMVPEPTPSE
jgi:hypothetical protein